MLKFHLDKLLKDNDLTINSFTNLLNEENEDESKNISRKSITAIANNSAKNVQLSIIEKILVFFKIPIDQLITLETSDLVYKFKLCYKHERNFQRMITIKETDYILPSLFLDIYKDNKPYKHFTFMININFDDEVTTKQKGFVNSLTLIPIITTPVYSSEEEKLNFEEAVANNFNEVMEEQLGELDNFISLLTANDIEEIFKPILDSVANLIKDFYDEYIVISETFYFDITNIIMIPIIFKLDNGKLLSDFSMFNQLVEFSQGVYQKIAKEKTVWSEIEIIKEK